MGASCLEMRGVSNLTQDRSIPMTEQAVSPLRRRMIEDMSIRKFAGKTQHDYVQRVKEFATFLGRSPDTAKSDNVRRFRLHLTSSGAGAPKINATVAALRFFFKVTLDRADLTKAPVIHARAAQSAGCIEPRRGGAWPPICDGVVTLTATQLSMLLDGLDW